MKNHDIRWIKYKFIKKDYFAFKLIDFIKIILLPIIISIYSKIDIIHCRGHLPSISGLILRKFFNKKFIFDCRGLWADERLDNKNWDYDKILFKLIYKFFKFCEKRFFINADQVIVLTKKIKTYLLTIYPNIQNKISVIPCVADFSYFKILKKAEILKMKKKLNISNNDFIIGYFGSLSNIYMPDEMIKFFLLSKKYIKNCKIIFFSDNFEYILKYSNNFKLLKKKDFMLVSLLKRDLAVAYNICDVTLCFVKNSFARMASSPTKIGESLACGVPVLCNANVGDINNIIPKIYYYGVFDVSIYLQMLKTSKKINSFKLLNRKKIRNKSKFYFDLSNINQTYKQIYSSLTIKN